MARASLGLGQPAAHFLVAEAVDEDDLIAGGGAPHEAELRGGQGEGAGEEVEHGLIGSALFWDGLDLQAQDVVLPAQEGVPAGRGDNSHFEVSQQPRSSGACLQVGRRFCYYSHAMPDMLVRLYDLPDAGRYVQRIEAEGIGVRRAEPWERARLRAFVGREFGELWAVEVEMAFNGSPITAYVAEKDGDIVGFAAYECTRRGFLGPTGVREEMRGKGVGAALLFRCLESMREMGYAYAVIGGVGPASFYEKVCGAFVIPGSEVGVYRPLFELMGKESR